MYQCGNANVQSNRKSIGFGTYVLIMLVTFVISNADQQYRKLPKKVSRIGVGGYIAGCRIWAEVVSMVYWGRGLAKET